MVIGYRLSVIGLSPIALAKGDERLSVNALLVAAVEGLTTKSRKHEKNYCFVF